MAKEWTKKLICENGREFLGYSFGADETVVSSLIFSTAMVGYQEALTDPTAADLAIVMTYPIVGSYGIADEDNEAKSSLVDALIVREYNDHPSNFRAKKTLSEFMKENNIVGISGVDTRSITRMLRSEGTMRCVLCSPEMTLEEGLELIKSTPLKTDSVKRVSTKKVYYSRTAESKYNMVIVDLGIKQSVIKLLVKRGCNLTVVPYNTPASEIEALKPDGVLFSDGPGSPNDVPETLEAVRALYNKVPLFGIGLGHELIAISRGAKIEEMKVPHLGGNRLARNLETGKLEATSQAHMFVVNRESVENTDLSVILEDVIDKSVEGLKGEKVFSVQYNPEANPGPQDSEYIFDEFVKMMKGAKD